MTRRMLLVAGVWGLASVPAHAAGEQRADDTALDRGVSGPLLPQSVSVEPRWHWVVGVMTESSAQRIEGNEVIAQSFVGLSTGVRYAWANPHLRLLVGGQGVEARYLAGLGFRTFFVDLWGTELSYGIGVHFDARLARHYWLAGATPLELGATLFDRRSWAIQLFGGARVAVAGRLLNSYLVDPNGFDNQAARDDLEDARDRRPWEAFLSVVFGRKVE